MLEGQWKLVYTSNSELFGLLALSRLPFVAIGDITQKIEASTFTVENKAWRPCTHCVHALLPSAVAGVGYDPDVRGRTSLHTSGTCDVEDMHACCSAAAGDAPYDVMQGNLVSAKCMRPQVALTVPFSRTSFSTSASFEVRSPKRLQVRFERGTVATPELLQDVELPDSVSVLGQPIDLTSLKARDKFLDDDASWFCCLGFMLYLRGLCTTGLNDGMCLCCLPPGRQRCVRTGACCSERDVPGHAV